MAAVGLLVVRIEHGTFFRAAQASDGAYDAGCETPTFEKAAVFGGQHGDDLG